MKIIFYSCVNSNKANVIQLPNRDFAFADYLFLFAVFTFNKIKATVST